MPAGAGSGLVAPPVGVTVLKIVGVAVAAVVLVMICNTDRGALVPIKGMPWIMLIVLGVSRGVDGPARPHEVRSLRLRHRRQRRGGAARRRQPRSHPHPVLRAVLVHRGYRRHRVRVAAAVGLDEPRRRAARAVRGRGRGHRRHQPLRRTGQADPRGAWVASSSPPSTTAWGSRASARRRSTSSPGSCSSPRSPSTPSPGGAVPPGPRSRAARARSARPARRGSCGRCPCAAAARTSGSW